MNLETQKKKGRKPLDKSKKMVALPVIRVLPTEKEALMREAIGANLSVSAYVRGIIMAAMLAVAV